MTDLVPAVCCARRTLAFLGALAELLVKRSYPPHGHDRERGQTTAEYALVLLGAATVATLLIAWAASSGKIDALFNRVFDQLIAKAR